MLDGEDGAERPEAMIQALFLLSVIAGALTLVAAIFTARMHWRLDIGPYHERYAWRVLRRPGSYVQQEWVGSVQALALVGCCLVAVAIGSLIYQAAVDWMR